ncbi:MAG: ankyrin repeat domain-containing protein [Gemmatimonadaceae bacterium]
MNTSFTSSLASGLGVTLLALVVAVPAHAQDKAAKTRVPASTMASSKNILPEKSVAPALANAAMRGDIATVRTLLAASKATLNVPQGDGMTALHWAADRGDLAMTQLLLKSGAKVSATTRLGGYTPLDIAAQKGKGDVVRALLVAGADPNLTTVGGSTALHYAAESSSPEAVAALLEFKANPNAREKQWGQTPLMYAANANRPAAIKALLKGKADPNLQTESVELTVEAAAEAAASKRRSEVMKSMLPANIRDSLAAAGAKATAGLASAGAARGGAAASRGDTGAAAGAGRGGRGGRGGGRGGAMGQATVAVVPKTAADSALAAKAPGADGTPPVAGSAAAGPRAGGGRGDNTPYYMWLSATQMQEAIAAGRKVLDSADAANAAAKASKMAQASVATKGDTVADVNGNLSTGQFSAAVGSMGGLAALHHAVRQGNTAAALALIDGGADINERTASDSTTPLLMATINGQFDLAMELIKRGANVKLASTAGATPLYNTINTQWAPRSRYPQPQDVQVQKTTHLELMTALIKAGADVNVRLKKNLWYFGFNNCGNGNCGLEYLDGTTPLWRAAYAVDLDAMKMLVAAGADPSLGSIRPAPGAGGRGGAAGRGAAGGAAAAAAGGGGALDDAPAFGRGAPVVLEPAIDSASKAVPAGTGVFLIHAVAGVGYGNGFAGNSHRHAPDGWMPAMKYVVETLHADVNQRDNNGYTALHHAAARGDNEMILYLVAHGADPKAVARNGRTTIDIANGPVERLRPFPETIKLLEKLGVHNSHKCVSC